MTPAVMAIVAALIAGGYLVGISYALLAPKRHPDPHDGVAHGCLMIATLPAFLVLALLALGHFGGHPRLVKFLFYLCVYPCGYVILMLAAQGAMRWWRK